jgi:hypothetical protein
VGSSLLGADPFLLNALGVPDTAFAPEKDPNYYPPAKTGLRGSHVGSFEVAHSLRDGRQYEAHNLAVCLALAFVHGLSVRKRRYRLCRPTLSLR